MNRSDRSPRRDALLALLLGAVSALGFAPVDAWPLTLAALAGLFALLQEQTPARAAWLGWLFGTTHFLCGIYWIFVSAYLFGGAPLLLSALLTWLLAALVMAPWLSLAFAIAAWLRVWQRAAGWLAVPALWLAAELLRGQWPFGGFAWLSLGSIAVDTPLRALAPLCGEHGISALLVLLAFALWRLCSDRGAARWRALAAILAVIGAAALLPAPSSWTQPLGAPLRVAIVQGNIPQEQKWLPEMELPTLRTYRDLTLSAKDVDVIVWPESALTLLYDELDEPFLRPLSAILRERQISLLAGILTERQDPHGYLNSVYALGASEGRYDKRHLVPFGEYFPVPGWLRPLLDVLGAPYDDLSVGAEQRPPLQVHGQQVGVAICFEDVFADEYRRSAAEASLMTIVTNDAWFGRSGAAAQHLQMARLRAQETGREILRASNTGVSAVIDADGSLRAQAGFYTRETVRSEVQPRRGTTPYAAWGDRPLWLLVALGLGAGWLGRRRAGQISSP